MTPPSRWTDDSRELALRLGAIGIPADVLKALGASAEVAAGEIKASAAAINAIAAAHRSARFVVYWSFDHTSQATVTINRAAGTISVRPYRRRRSYTLPLAFVAQLIAERITKAEALEKRKRARRVRR